MREFLYKAWPAEYNEDGPSEVEGAVLVADDDALLRHITLQILKEYGVWAHGEEFNLTVFYLGPFERAEKGAFTRHRYYVPLDPLLIPLGDDPNEF